MVLITSVEHLLFSAQCVRLRQARAAPALNTQPKQNHLQAEYRAARNLWRLRVCW